MTCYLSRAKTGGVKGGLGLAEDRAEASIACRQVGPIRFTGKLKDGEEVFKERTSLVFKTMQVVRFFDQKRNTLVYLVYSDRVIEGSPAECGDGYSDPALGGAVSKKPEHAPAFLCGLCRLQAIKNRPWGRFFRNTTNQAAVASALMWPFRRLL